MGFSTRKIQLALIYSVIVCSSALTVFSFILFLKRYSEEYNERGVYGADKDFTQLLNSYEAFGIIMLMCFAIFILSVYTLYRFRKTLDK